MEDLRHEFVLDDVVGVLGPDGDADPDTDPRLSDAECVALYGHLAMARRLDATLRALRDEGRIANLTGAPGDDAVGAAAASALTAGDWLFPGVCDAASVLARGVSLDAWMAHALGTADDPAKARQRPDHFSSRADRVVGTNPRLASQTTQAAGLAWAMRMRNDRHAVLCLLDGASAEAGEFHNGLNFAGVFRAPVVFLSRAHQGVAVAQKAFAYGVQPARVDGGDPLAVVRVVRDALSRAREGHGATLIEAQVPDHDGALARLRTHLTRRGTLTPALDGELTARCDAALAAAVERASHASAPALSTAFDDVFATAPWHLAEQRARATT